MNAISNPKTSQPRRFEARAAAVAVSLLVGAGAFAAPVASPTQAQRAKATTEAAPAGATPLRIVVAFEPVNQESNGFARGLALEGLLAKVLGAPVHVVSNRSLREIAIGTRSGEYDALWVPSNLAVSAVKNPHYEMVGFDGRMTPMALVVAADIQKFDDLKRRTLYLPQEDSTASGVATALLSDHGIRPSDFSTVFTSGSYEIGTFAIDKHFCSATVLPEATAKAWFQTHPGTGRILEVSAPVPGQTLVVRKDLAPARKQQLAEWAAKDAQVGALTPTAPAPFKYVTGLSHYTPDDVASVKKVTASEVTALAKAGAEVVDVRTSAEYQAKHIPSARLVPYVEESPRFLDADLRADPFDLTKLAGVKKIVLYCNGPECWKSFKAAQRAVASKQFEAVYWFRGGMPEWERSGLPTSGSVMNASVAANSREP